MRFSSLEPRGQKNLQPYEDQLSKTNSLMKQAGSGPNFDQKVSSDDRQLGQFFILKEAINYHGWMESIIMNGFPFSFIENDFNLKYFDLSKLSRSRL